MDPHLRKALRWPHHFTTRGGVFANTPNLALPLSIEVPVPQSEWSYICVLEVPCSTHYCVQLFTVSSKILCPHFLLIYTCSTFPCRHDVVPLCCPLYVNVDIFHFHNKSMFDR